jgi:hypothetical protein
MFGLSLDEETNARNIVKTSPFGTKIQQSLPKVCTSQSHNIQYLLLQRQSFTNDIIFVKMLFSLNLHAYQYLEWDLSHTEKVEQIQRVMKAQKAQLNEAE